jgi:hypothetical protein
MDIDQDRILLMDLTVNPSESHDNLCFSATVLFDGIPIAIASNCGQGCSTFLEVFRWAKRSFTRAREFARTLPPISIECGYTDDPQGLKIEITLEILSDFLAEEMYVTHTFHAEFNREMLSNLLFLKQGRLFSWKGVKLRLVSDKAGLFAQTRSRHGQEIVILAELPREVAFRKWREYASTRGEP